MAARPWKSVEVETDGFGAENGNVLINSQGGFFVVLACLICVLCWCFSARCHFFYRAI